jgi:hypothetical protein
MRGTHGCDKKTMVAFGAAHPYHLFMIGTDTPYTRSVTLVLSEDEWRALRDAEPDAVGWLQRQVRERLSSEKEPARGAAKPAEYSVNDEY